MTIKNSLLKEAIADAKAVKEIAVENVRLSLQEAFTPRITSRLNQMIQNEIEGEEEEPEDDYIAPEEPVDEPSMEEPTDDGGDEIPISDEPTVIDEPSDEIPTEEPTDEIPDEAPVEEPVDDEDAELEALIRELETDITDDEIEEGIEDSSGIGNSDNKKPSTDSTDSSAIGKKKEKQVGDKAKETKDFLAEEEEDLDIDLDIDDADDEEEIDIDEIIKELEGGNTFDDEPEGDIDVLDSVDEEEIDIDEIIGELENPEDASNVNNIQGNDGCMKENRKLSRENRKLTSELKEYVDAVKFMKGKLNEVNLLNAKLLYTNKIFRAHALTNEQKMLVIESFDRATTARETKLTYVTLSETLNKVTSNKTSKTKVNEGVSKPAGSTKPTKKPMILSEMSSVAKRFKTLSNMDKDAMPNYRL